MYDKLSQISKFSKIQKCHNFQSYHKFQKCRKYQNCHNSQNVEIVPNFKNIEKNDIYLFIYHRQELADMLWKKMVRVYGFLLFRTPTYGGKLVIPLKQSKTS